MTPRSDSMIEPRGFALRKGESPRPTTRCFAAFRDLARDTGAWLLLGSIVVGARATTSGCANRSPIAPATVAWPQRYDKIHMFDVDLARRRRELSRDQPRIRPGEAAALASLPWGVLGMTVCYDLRFPDLYRALAQGGASFLSIPSAFTVPTGRAHWHVLLRARAIEAFCFVFAPAQSGEHAEGRRTFGHSLIIAPWGEVLAEAEDGPGFITASIDPAKVAEARRAVPSLSHDRVRWCGLCGTGTRREEFGPKGTETAAPALSTRRAGGGRRPSGRTTAAGHDLPPAFGLLPPPTAAAARTPPGR